MSNPNGNISTYLKSEGEIDEMEMNGWIRADRIRDPNMAQSERKLVRIIGYLGITVYEDMLKDRDDLKQRLTDMMERPEFRFGGEFRPQVLRLAAILESLEQSLRKIWTFLFSLAGNFENLHPMGSDFVTKLHEIDFERENEEPPIAFIISAGVEDPD